MPLLKTGETLRALPEIMRLLAQPGATIRVWHSSARKRDQAYMTLVRRPKIFVSTVDALAKQGLITTESRAYPFDYVITDKGRAALAEMKK